MDRRQQLFKKSMIMTLVYTLVLASVLYAIKIDLTTILKETGSFISNVLAEKMNSRNQAAMTHELAENRAEENKNETPGPRRESILLEAPIISQLPELQRGCEVTTLAMMLNYAGVKVDKLQLAKELDKDVTPLTWKNGQKYYGNPYRGFVGDMYTLSKPGFGVYHEPIAKLANNYLPGQIINLTGGDFSQIMDHLNKDVPVWVIINTEYRYLPENYFETWYTTEGPVTITYKEHAVLITGYDQEYIYFNDPLTNIKNRKAPIADFKAAWVQMGKQAITYKSK